MTDLAKSLPAYDAIFSWLGGPESGWTMVGSGWRPVRKTYWFGAEFPCPWELHSAGYRCFLLHTDGTRVTVRAPEKPMPQAWWRLWFERIEDRIGVVGGGDYDKHVTWQHPQPATSLLAQFANISPNCFSCGRACESRCAVPVDGQHYGICKGCQVLHQAGHREAIAKRIREKVRRVPPPQTQTASWDEVRKAQAHLVKVPFSEVDCESAELLESRTCSTRDCHNPATVDALCGSCRWPGVPAERWPGLETLLAQQVASGGQSGAAARAMLARREDRRRVRWLTERIHPDNGQRRLVGVRPGPCMWRHELGADQRLDRKRSGR